MSDFWWTITLFPVSLYFLAKLITTIESRELRPRQSHALDTHRRDYSSKKTIVAGPWKTLGTLISSGVPILEAINIVKETANNAVFGPHVPADF